LKRIAIIGGGIAGLSAAFYLEKARQRGAAITYDLFEQSARLGGTLHTERIGDFVVEAGADSFLTEKPWAHELCYDLGLEGELIGSNDKQRKTCILVKGKLEPLPQGLQFIVPVTEDAMRSRLFSDGTREQFRREQELPPRTSDTDESVAAFVERHFGAELLERVADPMLAGIYGGEAERLSAHAVLPRFAEMERTTGSLVRALRSAETKHNDKPIFTSLKGGMGQMTEALRNRIDPSRIHLNSKQVEALGRKRNKWSLSGSEFDAIVLALPAWAASKLIASSSRALAQCLGRIRYTSSLIVALGFKARVRGESVKLPEGFGFLVPRSEKRRLLACTLVHNKFPHRVPEGAGLTRLFFGGARDEAVLTLSDREAVVLARKELGDVTGFEAEPDLWRVRRWPKAMPQYDVGHLGLVEEIENLAQEVAGFALAGNAYRGVGIPDCIRAGREAAMKMTE